MQRLAATVRAWVARYLQGIRKAIGEALLPTVSHTLGSFLAHLLYSLYHDK